MSGWVGVCRDLGGPRSRDLLRQSRHHQVLAEQPPLVGILERMPGHELGGAEARRCSTSKGAHSGFPWVPQRMKARFVWVNRAFESAKQKRAPGW